MRDVILAASREPHVESFITHGPGRALAERFIAGETLDDAVARTEELRRRGYRVSLDYLGESVSGLDQARAAATVYHETIERTRGVRGPISLSIKPSQFGIDLDARECLRLVREVASHAAALDRGVRLDMEDSHHTDLTLRLWRELKETGPEVGVVLQAALYRTPTDLATVLAANGSVRLCKGAYAETATIAYARKADVDRAYLQLLNTLLFEVAGTTAATTGPLPRAAIATHDERMIDYADVLTRRLRIDPAAYEFQMLYGVRRDLQERLLGRGRPIRIYLPWGPAWYPYLTRRLAERPANVAFFLKSLVAEATAANSKCRTSIGTPSGTP